ncbi:MAG: GDSL family lipase [Oscillospiraceae bacterium]|nr:GDSL family lipase [Oscillospiraceae bacterium]
MKLRSKVFAGLAAAMMLLTCGCAGGSSSTAGASTDVQASENISVTESENMNETKTYNLTSENVKLIGRTVENNGTLWLALSASGVEFTFTGTKLTLNIAGDNNVSAGKDKQARFAVYIDGEKTLDTQVDAAEKAYDIFTADEAKEVTVKILKLSEAAESIMGIRSIEATGSELKPTAEKDLKIEFIGDSITCGYGVDDEVKENHFSTSTEDATKAYAYKTAVALDADYSLVSYSGHGIISGYTDNDKKVTSQLVPPVYEKFAKTYTVSPEFNPMEIDWDFSRFVPDFIVINLGTNDASYCGNHKDRVTEYAEKYTEFIKKVREHNPDAHIICALGVMGDSLYKGVQMAVKAYTEETGDAKVSYLRLKPQDGTTGYAADWHPTEATHEIASATVVEEIKKLMAE